VAEIILKTDRLLLRRLNEDHRADMIEFYGDPDVMAIRKYGVRHPEGAGQAFDIALRHWDEHGFGLFAVHHGVSDDFMGECGLRYLDDETAVELSYGLLTRFQGRGLATEAATACLGFGKNTLNLPTVVAFSRADNIASHGVLRKIGMEFIRCDDRGTHGVVRYETRPSM
jgi:ribosomal-protein-alanine N-acetyltransferase